MSFEIDQNEMYQAIEGVLTTLLEKDYDVEKLSMVLLSMGISLALLRDISPERIITNVVAAVASGVRAKDNDVKSEECNGN